MNIHRNQARIIRALFEQDPDIHIGMEFFYRDDDKALKLWSKGWLTEKGLINMAGWYSGGGGYNFGYYRPFLGFSAQNNIPVIGLNIPRTILRKVSTGGLDSLSPEDKEIVGEVDTSNAEHRQLIMHYFSGAAMTHGQNQDEEAAKARLDRMYTAQCVWDNVFADSVINYMKEKDGIFVVIVGSGHTAYKLGTNRRLIEKTSWPTASVYPVSIEKGESTAIVARSIGDFLLAVEEDTDPAYYPSSGLSVGERNGKVMVGMLMPGSKGKEAGLNMGDVVLELDGKPVTDISDFKIRLAAKKWGESIVLRIKRGEEEKVVTIPLEK
jgi:uncharacterized iron-regulated protein